jgi:hypothetical protein
MPTTRKKTTPKAPAPKALPMVPAPKPGAGELDSDELNRQGQITQRSLTPQEYQQKMDQVNRMRQQQGQDALPVTPQDQIATPKSTKPQTLPRIPTDQLPPQAKSTTPQAKPSAPKMANDPKRPNLRVGGDPKVYDLQRQLIRQGAKIQADGIMGPNTQRAINQFSGDQLTKRVDPPIR